MALIRTQEEVSQDTTDTQIKTDQLAEEAKVIQAFDDFKNIYITLEMDAQQQIIDYATSNKKVN